MSRIVTTTYCPKRPRKRKAVAIAGPAIVRKRAPTYAPVNDDRKPAIVTTISRKRARLMRAAGPDISSPDDPEAAAAMRAWIERAIWGHGPR